MQRSRLWFLGASILALLLINLACGTGIAVAVEANGPGQGEGTNFSAACLQCKNDCETNYPTPLGPQQTCKKMCVDAGTCPAASVVRRPIEVPPSVGNKMAPASAPAKE
jgi:hypothetical protein